MKTTDALFISHCDDDNCTLGSFEYECPNCDKIQNDYEIWWKQDDLYDGKIERFTCESCQSILEVFWDRWEYQFTVKVASEH